MNVSINTRNIDPGRGGDRVLAGFRDGRGPGWRETARRGGNGERRNEFMNGNGGIVDRDAPPPARPDRAPPGTK